MSPRGFLTTPMKCSACDYAIQAVVGIAHDKQAQAVDEWSGEGAAPEVFDGELCPSCGGWSMRCVAGRSRRTMGESASIALGHRPRVVESPPEDAVTVPAHAFAPDKPIAMGVTNEAIANLRAEYEGLEATDRESHKAVVEAHRQVKGLRSAVEKKRKELKAPALEFGKAVDAEAKRITGELKAIEGPLEKTRKAYETAEAEQKRAAEEAARKLQRDRMATIESWGEVALAHAVGRTSAEVQEAIDCMKAAEPTEEAFGAALLPRARQAHERALGALSQALQAAQKAEREAEERREREEREAVERAAAEAHAREVERQNEELRRRLEELEARSAPKPDEPAEKPEPVVVTVDTGGPVHREHEVEDLPALSPEDRQSLADRGVHIVDPLTVQGTGQAGGGGDSTPETAENESGTETAPHPTHVRWSIKWRATPIDTEGKTVGAEVFSVGVETNDCDPDSIIRAAESVSRNMLDTLSVYTNAGRMRAGMGCDDL